MSDAHLLIFTKPARPGRVKTRLIGPAAGAGSADEMQVPDGITAERAARLHQAFLDDLTVRLLRGAFDLTLAWALDPEEERPAGPVPSLRQNGADLGERLFHGLAVAATIHELVAAVGSDHPELPLEVVEGGFARLRSGAEVVLGPSLDGGYYFVGARRGSLHHEIFEGIEWSTSTVLQATLARCRQRSLTVELLDPMSDVDTPEDLHRLALRLARGNQEGDKSTVCARTESLLREWGYFGEAVGAPQRRVSTESPA